MDKPQIADAPGLAWRPRKNGWAAVWLARQDIAKKGFKPSTRQILVLTAPPTEKQETAIRTACVRFQEEMYEFGGGLPKTFGGRVRDLISAYQTDKDCDYKKLGYDSRREADGHILHIDRMVGTKNLADLGARDFKHIYEQTRWPDGNQEVKGKVFMAHKRLGVVRRIFSYGMAFEVDPQCKRLREILSELKFENGKPREEAMSLRQCEDIIAAAHRLGFPSIALSQAAQWVFRCRQRDVIGYWVPVTEPGISVLPPQHGKKWLRGMRHEEISSTGILSHPTSKSRGHTLLERDINLYPMFKVEYDRIPVEKRTGPIVICEITGRPWTRNTFGNRWRECAVAAGVPSSVWNMDSRAGGITETIEATGGNLEAGRKEAGHRDQKMTARYSRRSREAIDETAVIVADFRAKNTA